MVTVAKVDPPRVKVELYKDWPGTVVMQQGAIMAVDWASLRRGELEVV